MSHTNISGRGVDIISTRFYAQTVKNYGKDLHRESTWFVGACFDHTPPLLDKFVGCLLGLAVGDSLGSPLEGSDLLMYYLAVF